MLNRLLERNALESDLYQSFTLKYSSLQAVNKLEWINSDVDCFCVCFSGFKMWPVAPSRSTLTAGVVSGQFQSKNILLVYISCFFLAVDCLFVCLIRLHYYLYGCTIWPKEQIILTAIWFKMSWNNQFCVIILIFTEKKKSKNNADVISRTFFFLHLENKIFSLGHLCCTAVLHHDAVCSHIWSLTNNWSILWCCTYDFNYCLINFTAVLFSLIWVKGERSSAQLETVLFKAFIKHCKSSHHNSEWF